MLILYDIDMTLLATNHIGIELLRQAGAHAFTPGFSAEGIDFGGCLDQDIIRRMLINNGLEPTQENIAAMRHGYASRLADYYDTPDWSIPLPGAHDLVNATAELGNVVTLGLLTGNFPETGILKLRAAGFEPDLFTVNAWGDDSPHELPHRSHLPPVAMSNYHSAKGAPIDPQSVLIIGDTIHDVSCAKDNGCRVLAVATGHASFDELQEAGADRVINDLTQTRDIIDWIMAHARS